MNESKVLKKSLLERLVRYCHFMQDKVLDEKITTVSSAQVAAYAELDESQVRKDLAAIGVRGTPRVGYRADDVVSTIRDRLGFDESYKAVLVGAGRLGGAIISYPGFAKYGLHIVAVVDSDPRKTGSMISGLVVQPMHRLGQIVRREQIELGILTVPRASAQATADRLIDLEIKALWNFAPIWISVPDDVHVRHEHLSVGLADLAYHLSS